uniref:Uncharacterized protein n=1 Tax=Arundo donax TaxID=35708 RepID=A0A0A8YS77_ARUDO
MIPLYSVLALDSCPFKTDVSCIPICLVPALDSTSLLFLLGFNFLCTSFQSYLVLISNPKSPTARLSGSPRSSACQPAR